MPASAPDPEGKDHRRRLAFPRRSRLLHAREFRRVFERPVRSADQLLTILARTNEGNDGARLGLAIARKAVPTAVHRNRIKRLVRESFRAALAQLPSVDVVVMARQGAGEHSNARLRQSLSEHWQRIRRQCESS